MYDIYIYMYKYIYIYTCVYIYIYVGLRGKHKLNHGAPCLVHWNDTVMTLPHTNMTQFSMQSLPHPLPCAKHHDMLILLFLEQAHTSINQMAKPQLHSLEQLLGTTLWENVVPSDVLVFMVFVEVLNMNRLERRVFSW